MATLLYGGLEGVRVHAKDDVTASAVREIITAIVRAGAYEWLPLPGNVNGQRTVVNVLVGPGIPVMTIGSDDDAGDRLDEIASKYVSLDATPNLATLAFREQFEDISRDF